MVIRVSIVFSLVCCALFGSALREGIRMFRKLRNTAQQWEHDRSSNVIILSQHGILSNHGENLSSKIIGWCFRESMHKHV